MNRSTPEFDQRIAEWLEADPNTAPADVLSTVVAALPSVPQARRSLRAPFRLTGVGNSLRAAAAIAIVAIVGIGILAFGTRTPDQGTPSPLPTATPTPAPSPTAAPSQAQLTYTSEVYGYTVEVPVGWDVIPATVRWPAGGVFGDGTEADWVDAFLETEPDFPEVGYTGVAAQPIPSGTTADEWMLAYAKPHAASGFACSGDVADWVSGEIGPLVIRRVDIVCDGSIGLEDVTGLHAAEVLFVIDDIGYLMSGNPVGIDALINSLQPG